IPVDTFNKVWIVPDNAAVFEKDSTAVVVSCHLKVMLETDYLATSHNAMPTGGHVTPPADQLERGSVSPSQLPVSQPMNAKAPQGNPLSTTSQNDDLTPPFVKEMIRDIVLPELEKEVNTGEYFAPLRQVYYSMILATWFKQTLKESVLGQIYADKSKTAGVQQPDIAANEMIYQKYLEAFKKGAFNYIKEDHDLLTDEVIPRKYFSGGIQAMARVEKIVNTVLMTDEQKAFFNAAERSDADFATVTLVSGASSGLAGNQTGLDKNASAAQNIVGWNEKKFEMSAGKAASMAAVFKGDAWISAGRFWYKIWLSNVDGVEKVSYRRYDKKNGKALGAEKKPVDFEHEVSVGAGIASVDETWKSQVNSYAIGGAGLAFRHFSFEVQRSADNQPVLIVRHLVPPEQDAEEFKTVVEWETPYQRVLLRDAQGLEREEEFEGSAWIKAGSKDYIFRVWVEGGEVRLARYSADRIRNIEELAPFKPGVDHEIGREMFAVDREMSGRHFMFRVTRNVQGRYFIFVKDLYSSNKTTVEWIAPEEDSSLNPEAVDQYTKNTEWEETVWEQITKNEGITPEPFQPDDAEPRTMKTEDVLTGDIVTVRKNVKDLLFARNGRSGLSWIWDNGWIRIKGQDNDSPNYKNLLAIVEVGMNYVLQGDESRKRRILEHASGLKKVEIAEGYHDFKLLTAREILVGDNPLPQGLSEDAREFFLKRLHVLGEYLDGDLMRDILRHLGGKSGKSHDVIGVLREYFELIYRIERTEDLEEYKKTMTALVNEYKSNKFAKVFELGRQKVRQNGQLVLNENNVIGMLDPRKTPFRLAPASDVDGFYRYIQGLSLVEQKGNFYIFPRRWDFGGRQWLLAARDGRLELFYASTTYSTVAGQYQWCRQEAALATIMADGRVSLRWYAKPFVETSHDVNDVSANEINRIIYTESEKGAFVLDASPESKSFVSQLHLDLGLAFGPDGQALSRDDKGRPQYGNNIDLNVDFRRYTAWLGAGMKHAQDQRQLNLLIENYNNEEELPDLGLPAQNQSKILKGLNSNLDAGQKPADVGGIDLNADRLNMSIRR
ncbi:MAG: hypothetical protein HQL22_12725, partial [Candidatus Omnitrophica bacterium]|nr:hypothetical protein [Candidatus Omnitrophota bacterium]